MSFQLNHDSDTLNNRLRADVAAERSQRWAEFIDGPVVEDPDRFSAKWWATQSGPTKIYYVSEDGKDDDSEYAGKSFVRGFRTIGRAIQEIQAWLSVNQQQFGPRQRVSIHVAPGYYSEVAPVRVPPDVSIIGNDLRTVVVRPTQATKYENLFELNNACYVWGLRLEGCIIDDLEVPGKGFFFAFAPGAFISTSPYVQNCTAINTPFDKFYAPMNPQFETNPANPNPEVGNGPGGMLVDDTILNPSSPLKSMLIDAFTQVAFNGIGICVRNRGYAQLVSFFTNFSRVGVYCLDGGQVSCLNSNTTFGDYGLRAKGRRFIVVADVSGVPSLIDPTAAIAIRNNKNDIIDAMMAGLIAADTVGDYSVPGSMAAMSTRMDAGLLVDALADDFLSPKAGRVAQFVQALFTGKDMTGGSRTLPSGAVAVFPLQIVNDIALAHDLIEQEIELLLNEVSRGKLSQLVLVVKNTLNSVINVGSSEFVQEFGSQINSTAHDFSYAGAGVNFLALPPNQGGVGSPMRIRE